jgi:protease-4
MSLDADMIVDRRRMRRKLTFWRVVAALVALVAVIGGAVLATSSGREAIAGGGSIARVKITGLIRSDSDRVAALERLGKSSARAVIIQINSPGGTTAGSEQLYDSITRLKAQKPVVVVVEGLAASGGYIAALASDQIIAQQSALVGSIGVLFQYPNFGDLMKTIGVKVEEVKSSPLKAAPNGFEPTSPEARAALESIVRDSYGWFRNLVQTRRSMDNALLDRVADGRVFTGRQALELKLIDQIGDEKTALAWLEKEKNVKADTPVRDFRLDSRIGNMSFLRVGAVVMLDAVGLSATAERLQQTGLVQSVDRMSMDGLLALWQPASSN